MAIPLTHGGDRALDDGVLADALTTVEHQRVIDLLGGLLDAMC